MSRRGNQRSSYTQYVKVDEHMVLVRSDKSKGDTGNETGSYHALINPITCQDNQMMTCPTIYFSISRCELVVIFTQTKNLKNENPYFVFLTITL